jgi:hypothetical protein
MQPGLLLGERANLLPAYVTRSQNFLETLLTGSVIFNAQTCCCYPQAASMDSVIQHWRHAARTA